MTSRGQQPISIGRVFQQLCFAFCKSLVKVCMLFAMACAELFFLWLQAHLKELRDQMAALRGELPPYLGGAHAWAMKKAKEDADRRGREAAAAAAAANRVVQLAAAGTVTSLGAAGIVSSASGGRQQAAGAGAGKPLSLLGVGGLQQSSLAEASAFTAGRPGQAGPAAGAKMIPWLTSQSQSGGKNAAGGADSLFGPSATPAAAPAMGGPEYEAYRRQAFMQQYMQQLAGVKQQEQMKQAALAAAAAAADPAQLGAAAGAGTSGGAVPAVGAGAAAGGWVKVEESELSPQQAAAKRVKLEDGATAVMAATGSTAAGVAPTSAVLAPTPPPASVLQSTAEDDVEWEDM